MKLLRDLGALAFAAVLAGCTQASDIGGPWQGVGNPVALQRPQTVVLFPTPKFISDFSNPDADISRFFDQYASMTSHASETIVVFAVGNSDHILNYRGTDWWMLAAEWAFLTDWQRVDRRDLNYTQIAKIVASFKAQGAARGLHLKVFDQIDSGDEFAVNTFKLITHTECFPKTFLSWDIRAKLTADPGVYASRRTGIPAGTSCGTFLADQVAVYLNDLGFDGILYGNQLGTRGRWVEGNGPGWSDDEAAAIRDFFAYSKRVLGDKGLMWFDSYNNTRVEHDTWSVPSDAYQYFDYLLVAGFCVVTDPAKYQDDLQSKLKLRPHPKIIGTLDYLDPWYSYKSMVQYADESAELERTAIANRTALDGFVFFANGAAGELIPKDKIDSFASRYFDK